MLYEPGLVAAVLFTLHALEEDLRCCYGRISHKRHRFRDFLANLVFSERLDQPPCAGKCAVALAL